MGKLSISLALAIALVVASARAGLAQSGYDAIAWQTLAEKLEAGVTVDVRLRDRQHFKATFIDARPDALVVQRKTRLPVPVELIPYESIASMARAERSSLTAARVAGIALGAAGAVITTFFVILLAYSD